MDAIIRQARQVHMTSLVKRQVSAYHESVMNASRAAVECWDMHKMVHEMILMSPGMVSSIEAVVTSPGISDDPNEQQDSLETCQDMLTCLNWLAREAVKLREHNFELAGLPKFHDAITQLRFVMADVLDTNAATGAPATPDAAAPAENIEADRRDLPPPQSWY
jgi:hypothetical protein